MVKMVQILLISLCIKINMLWIVALWERDELTDAVFVQ
ncbi:putative membrane protein [Escherichia coli 2-210-07_S3_C2]|nr:putative membrane protein [Escherichia coli 2-210-07_S3_C2]